jgi:hypothetical protein
MYLTQSACFWPYSQILDSAEKFSQLQTLAYSATHIPCLPRNKSFMAPGVNVIKPLRP